MLRLALPRFAVPLVLGAAACGGELTRAEPGLRSSPWLLTYESTGNSATRIDAHRLHDGKTEHVHLAEAARLPVAWSPSRRWLAYSTRPAGGGQHVWVRSFDGERWGTPQAVTLPAAPEPAIASFEWSPARDQLLFVAEAGAKRETAIATVREDGSVAARSLAVESGARWTPTGDRLVVVDRLEGRTRVDVIDVPSDGAGVGTWPSRAIAPPEGSSFDDVERHPETSGISAGTVSSDGRWIVFAVKNDGDASKSLQAFSLTGDQPTRTLKSCPIAPTEAVADLCWPSAWAPEGASLLLDRSPFGHGPVDVWSVENDVHVPLALERRWGWIGLKGKRLLLQDPSSRALSIVDMDNPASPVVTPLPSSTSPSFRSVNVSGDGRWVLLWHQDATLKADWLEVIDLRGGVPAPAREIFRTAMTGRAHGLYWSPGGTFVLVPEDNEDDRKRAVRVDLETGARSVIDLKVYPEARSAPEFPSWDWSDRFSPDDRILAIDHEGTLALRSLDAPESRPTILDGVPGLARIAWVPMR